ncbi:helix-turn-helix domain-containing protein [Fusibacter tunisiensis]|uniref:Transcriptional regulator with XRE-family HTH domain n=1 Tax=Fusibacter tunisiensis TaxID=1008308 RepID=A0ABS2MTY5_9FIRM|nr:helix-turn-helix transcriptional regulator [Fusibacter tunisiensis]MBM7562903.1 transcriptional regulator with XRE-family HTH domain [Fusibacter tunisiensis]
MNLTMGEKIRILLKRKNVTIIELSKRLGTTNQNMANKFKRDNFSVNELEAIAKALGTCQEFCVKFDLKF